MKRQCRLAALLSLGMVFVVGCKHEQKPLEGKETEKIIQTDSGAAIVDTMTVDATVAKIDASKRAVTLKGADGGESTFTAGNHVDLEKLKVGDKVHATITEALAIYLSKAGAPMSIGDATGVALTTSADKREVVMANTAELTAKVTAVDTANRKVSLKFVDGSSKNVKVGKQIDLANVKVGDDVVAKVAQAVTIAVTPK